jgi:hypothetical protein
MRLSAHFGHWREVRQRGHIVRRWQVAAGLIYGQVKKGYRRRKLVRVTHVMHLGTQTALQVTRPRLGFSGRLNTAFIERVNLTVRHDSRAGPSYLGHGEACSTPARSRGVVASVVSLCASSPLPARGARAATRARWQAGGATLSAANPCHGSRENPSTMDGS